MSCFASCDVWFYLDVHCRSSIERALSVRKFEYGMYAIRYIHREHSEVAKAIVKKVHRATLMFC